MSSCMCFVKEFCHGACCFQENVELALLQEGGSAKFRKRSKKEQFKWIGKCKWIDCLWVVCFFSLPRYHILWSEIAWVDKHPTPPLWLAEITFEEMVEQAMEERGCSSVEELQRVSLSLRTARLGSCLFLRLHPSTTTMSRQQPRS